VAPLTLSAIRRSVIDPVAGADNLAYSHGTLEAAAALGVGLVSVGLHRPLLAEQTRTFWFWLADGPRDDPADWQLAVERLRELGRHADQLGLALSLEMYEDTLLDPPTRAVRLVEAIGLANVGLNPDLGNLYRLHRPIEPFAEWIETCLPVTNYWHIKSYWRDEDPATGCVTAIPAPLELGTINYRAAIARAVELGFTGPFCVEHYGGDGLSVSALNARYLRRMLRVATGEAARQILGSQEVR
jgi:sugar phosphate isomerase/epimerase